MGPFLCASKTHCWVPMGEQSNHLSGNWRSFKYIQGDEIIVKDGDGNEVLRRRINNIGGLAIDLHLGLMF